MREEKKRKEWCVSFPELSKQFFNRSEETETSFVCESEIENDATWRVEVVRNSDEAGNGKVDRDSVHPFSAAKVALRQKRAFPSVFTLGPLVTTKQTTLIF